MDLKAFLEELFGCRVDLVLRDTIKPRLRETILNEALYAPGLCRHRRTWSRTRRRSRDRSPLEPCPGLPTRRDRGFERHIAGRPRRSVPEGGGSRRCVGPLSAPLRM